MTACSSLTSMSRADDRCSRITPLWPLIVHSTAHVAVSTIRRSPTVVNPFDRFGDRLRLALHAPASYQLLSWLVGGPGAELPERGRAPGAGQDGPE